MEEKHKIKSASSQKQNWLFALLVRMFSEKQLYLRGQGKVRFFTFTLTRQILLLIFVLGLISWLGVTSYIGVHFKEMTANHTRDKQILRAGYETTIANMKHEREQISDEISLSQNWFEETTRTLERRQKMMSNLLSEHGIVMATLDNIQDNVSGSASGGFKTILMAGQLPKASVYLESRPLRNDAIISDTPSIAAPARVSPAASPANTKNKNIDIQSNAATMPQNKTSPHIVSPHIHTRLADLTRRNHAMLTMLEESTDRKIIAITDLVKHTGLPKTEEFLARVPSDGQSGIGGPFIPLGYDVQSELDISLANQYNENRLRYRIANNIAKLADLMHSLTFIPLTAPVKNYPITSAYGSRLDPFHGRLAQHAGVDYGTPSKTPVHATLPGTVRFVGRKRQYGLVIELEHDNGFRTRYGHLGKILVKRGERITLQQIIAESGNTGRSTGPHLHYEIWYNGRHRNPMPFLNAGARVFTIAKRIQ